MDKTSIVLLTVLLGGSVSCTRPALAEKTAPPYRLSGPEVTKLEWNARAVRVADVDGDGLNDLALINNDKARIEVLYQRPEGAERKPTKRTIARNRWEPVLEDTRFEKVAVVSGIQMYDLAVGDLNDDGRVDMAYTGRPDALTVRYQDEDELWSDKKVFDLDDPVAWVGSTRIVDLNSDGRNDLVVMTDQSIEVYRQSAEGTLEGPTRYGLADTGAAELLLEDLNNDGRLDLGVVNPGERMPLRVRFAQAGGGFGPIRVFEMESPLSALRPVQIDDQQNDGDSKEPTLVYVQRKTGLVDTVRVGASEKVAGSAKALRPLIFATQAEGSIGSAYAVGDFDGNGRQDVAASDAQGARVLVYFQNETGELGEPRDYPSYAEIRSMSAADPDGDGRDELFISSAKEQALGVSRWVEPGRLSYPASLDLEKKPLAVWSGDLSGNGEVETAALVEASRKRYLWTDNGRDELELKGLRADPKELRALDANQDGRMDLAVFSSSDAMRLLIQGEDGTLTDLSTDPKFKPTMLDRLSPAALSLGDVDGDGKDEMLIAGGAYVRAVRLGDDGRLQVIDQFNARLNDAKITAAVAIDLDADGTNEVLLVDQKNNELQLLKRDASGVYRYAESTPIGEIDLVETRVEDMSGDGRPELLLFGKDRFWWYGLGGAGMEARSLGTYECDLEDVSYSTLSVGDLNDDGRDDLVAIDTRNTHVLEILSVGPGGRLTSRVHFPVFEVDEHYQGRGGSGSEPRQTIIDDVTGDGKDDLVLLIHDRLLVYPQR